NAPPSSRPPWGPDTAALSRRLLGARPGEDVAGLRADNGEGLPSARVSADHRTVRSVASEGRGARRRVRWGTASRSRTCRCCPGSPCTRSCRSRWVWLSTRTWCALLDAAGQAAVDNLERGRAPDLRGVTASRRGR